MDQKDFPRLGIGVGLRPSFYPELIRGRVPVDWLEIISDNYLQGGEPLARLKKVMKHYRVVMHGVGLHIGSLDPLDWDYLRAIKELHRCTQSPWISDHLSWGKLDGDHFHDLLPVPCTEQSVRRVVEKARVVQDYLEVPFALENVSSYALVAFNEMPEWELYRRVIEEAGIWSLLDLNNVYVSARNHGYTPEEYLAHVPMDRVIQIHLGGHIDYGTHCVDTHDQRVADSVWKLYQDVWPLTNGASTLLEWDRCLPSLQEVWEEAIRAKHYQGQCVHG